MSQLYVSHGWRWPARRPCFLIWTDLFVGYLVQIATALSVSSVSMLQSGRGRFDRGPFGPTVLPTFALDFSISS